MHTEALEFEGEGGQRLAARLDLPDGRPSAFAVFAHCFTCSKDSLAAVRIARALAMRGVGVLRFDFTGLGESEGEFADTAFSGQVSDLVAAARHLAGQGRAPRLLVGHSLGGAAALAAAGELPDVEAVAVIGAPFDAAHVTGLFSQSLDEIAARGEAEVDLGGRPFTIRRSFLADLQGHDQAARIGALRRPLLVLHAPLDQVVGIDNASQIFLAARHPKSFVSLDDADHLLTRPGDADYAAEVIAAWASRYLGAAGETTTAPPSGTVVVEETGAGRFQVQVTAGQARFFADEPEAVGGLGSGPTPYELLSAGLGACTAMTLRLYAGRKAWPLDKVRVCVGHAKDRERKPPDLFVRQIEIVGDLDEAQRGRLMEIADRCPVHRTLEGGAGFETRPGGGLPRLGEDATEHARAAEEACRDPGE